ncbi:hypothetical protein KIPB_002851 [Kipferlia bialata]|uniref:Uncharacterized protein n=1 Tax=Kipferlia bialata TaxID=797122 RepID=A0A9K3CS12_9EUKA|nr:hypothetical protein KIPB_002851 [Kipferlia bialata]|eukprot:g2851.t1
MSATINAEELWPLTAAKSFKSFTESQHLDDGDFCAHVVFIPNTSFAQRSETLAYKKKHGCYAMFAAYPVNSSMADLEGALQLGFDGFLLSMAKYDYDRPITDLLNTLADIASLGRLTILEHCDYNHIRPCLPYVNGFLLSNPLYAPIGGRLLPRKTRQLEPVLKLLQQETQSRPDFAVFASQYIRGDCPICAIRSLAEYIDLGGWGGMGAKDSVFCVFCAI